MKRADQIILKPVIPCYRRTCLASGWVSYESTGQVSYESVESPPSAFPLRQQSLSSVSRRPDGELLMRHPAALHSTHNAIESCCCVAAVFSESKCDHCDAGFETRNRLNIHIEWDNRMLASTHNAAAAVFPQRSSLTLTTVTNPVSLC